jgi:type IV pilus assembly protein PilB
LEAALKYLVDHKRISKDQLTEFGHGTDTASQVAQKLLNEGLLSKMELATAIAESSHLQLVSLRDYPLNRTTAALVSPELCRRYTLIPLQQTGNDLTVAIAEPSNVLAVDDLRAATKMNIKPVVAVRDEIVAAINQYLRSDAELSSLSGEIEQQHRPQNNAVFADETQENAPIVRFVNLLISQAIQDRASDIHIEPNEHDLRVRFRIDGVLHEAQRNANTIQAEVISRIKVMSDMDIAERRLPQDGRMTFDAAGDVRDLRVASLPTVWGEKIVIRILDSRSTNLGFADLGLSDSNLNTFRNSVKKPWGMTLVTGPTGSGKTTTLYAALGEVTGPEVNVITVEDPVEYRMDGINQMQVNPRAGLTFATSLRSILRADPNVIMIGEIRDRDTAQISVEAALTGHQVISTLHTNDAASAVTRLVELGVEPFLVASSLECVMAQRLARRLCDECKEAYTPNPDHLAEAGFLPPAKLPKLYRPVGCAHCAHTGFRGRMAIQEVMYVSEAIEQLVLERASSTTIMAQAVDEGMTVLRTDGFAKILEGLTSVEEVLRVIA